MFAVLGDILASLFWGLLISLVLISVIFLLDRAFQPNNCFSAKKLIALLLGFVFFLFQSTLLVGGLKARNYVRPLENALRMSDLPSISQGQDGVSPQALINPLIDQYPMLEKYITEAIQELSERPGQPSGLPASQVISDNLRSKVSYYTWRRAGWLAGGFCALLAFLLMAGERTKTNHTHRPPLAKGTYSKHYKY